MALYAGGSDPYSSIAAQNLAINKLGLDSQNQWWSQQAQQAQLALAAQRQQDEEDARAAAMASDDATRAQQSAMAANESTNTANEKAANILLGLKQLAQTGQLSQQQLDLQKQQLNQQLGIDSKIADNAGPTIADNLNSTYQPVKDADDAIAKAISERDRIRGLAVARGLDFDKAGNPIPTTRGGTLDAGAVHNLGPQYMATLGALQSAVNQRNDALQAYNIAHSEAQKNGFIFSPKDGVLTHIRTGKKFGPKATSSSDDSADDETDTASPPGGSVSTPAPDTFTTSPPATPIAPPDAPITHLANAWAMQRGDSVPPYTSPTPANVPVESPPTPVWPTAPAGIGTSAVEDFSRPPAVASPQAQVVRVRLPNGTIGTIPFANLRTLQSRYPGTQIVQ